MRRLFKAFAALALIPKGLQARPVEKSGDIIPVEFKNFVQAPDNSSYPWEGCDNTNSTDYCVYTWGPEEKDAPPVYNPTVVKECYEAKGCCPDTQSPTGYSNCPPSPEWKGCGDEESIPYCNASVVAKNSTSIDQCFEKKGCCEDKESSTQYADCPPSSFPEYAKFFVGEGVALVGGVIVQVRARCTNLHEITKTAGWMALGAGIFGGLGTLLGKERDDLEEDKASMVPLLSTIGMAAGLIGCGITAYRHYKAIALAQAGHEPLIPVELN